MRHSRRHRISFLHGRRVGKSFLLNFDSSYMLAAQEVFRTTLIKALSERLTQTISAANEQAARDTDQLFEEQAELGRRKQELDRGLQEAQVLLDPKCLQNIKDCLECLSHGLSLINRSRLLLGA